MTTDIACAVDEVPLIPTEIARTGDEVGLMTTAFADAVDEGRLISTEMTRRTARIWEKAAAVIPSTVRWFPCPKHCLSGLHAACPSLS